MRRLGLVPLCVLFILPLVMVLGSVYYDPSVIWQSDVSDGYIHFEQGFNATYLTFLPNLVVWTGFKQNDTGYFGQWGLDCPDGINLTLVGVQPTNLTMQTVYLWTGNVRVYVPSHGMPTKVTGVDNWAWLGSDDIIQLVVESNTTIEILWTEYYPSEEDPPAPAIPPSEDTTTDSSTSFLYQYLVEGNILGFVISSYSQSLGLTPFFLFVILGFSIPLYSRMGGIATALLWVLFWGIWNVALPPRGINVGVIMLILSISALVIMLFFGRRQDVV